MTNRYAVVYYQDEARYSFQRAEVCRLGFQRAQAYGDAPSMENWRRSYRFWAAEHSHYAAMAMAARNDLISERGGLTMG